jgi:hypothetical protein
MRDDHDIVLARSLHLLGTEILPHFSPHPSLPCDAAPWCSAPAAPDPPPSTSPSATTDGSTAEQSLCGVAAAVDLLGYATKASTPAICGNDAGGDSQGASMG